MKKLLFGLIAGLLLFVLVPTQVEASPSEDARCYSFTQGINYEQFPRQHFRWVGDQMLNRMEKAWDSCVAYARTAYGLYQ